MMVGQEFPQFSMEGCTELSHKEFPVFTQENLKGRWSVVFFWPLDFTFVCPTEISGFNQAMEDFEDRDAQVFGVSADSAFVHMAWRNQHDDLRNLRFPMLADYNKALSTKLGILHPQNTAPMRATYIIDPDGIIRHMSVNDLNVGRNVKEVLRTLDGLQTDELCPCNWEKGQATL
jgi:peroxiredoxin (alkyl hydroperoxide reductase subunit C)